MRPTRRPLPRACRRQGQPVTKLWLAFVDGDPDRPIILSAVPNTVSPSPVTSGNSLKNQIQTASGVLLEIKDS